MNRAQKAEQSPKTLLPNVSKVHRRIWSDKAIEQVDRFDNRHSTLGWNELQILNLQPNHILRFPELAPHIRKDPRTSEELTVAHPY